jgi:putative oxidoreductase
MMTWGNREVTTMPQGDVNVTARATRQELATSVGLLILRLGVGGFLLTHGWGKVQMLRAGQFEMMGDPIGLGSRLSLVLIVFAEFVCSLLVMAGLATRLAALPVAFAMGVAAFVAHGRDPWTMEGAAKLFFAGQTKMMLAKEPALIFLVVFLALAFTGAGRFSVDAVIRRLRSGRSGQPR